MKKRILATLVTAAMAVSLLYAGTPQTASAATEKERAEIAGLDYTYTGTEDVEKDADLNEAKFGDKENGYKFTTGEAKLFASVTGTQTKTLEWAVDDVADPETGVETEQIVEVYDMDGTKEYTPIMASTKKNPWPSDATGAMPYFEIQFSSKGMEAVEVSAYVGASKKGPKDYRMTYALGSSTEYTALTDETATISLEKNKKLQKISATLPEAAADQELVKVRIEVASLLQVDQSKATEEEPVLLTAGSGEAAINHISITGLSEATVVDTGTGDTNNGSTSANKQTVTVKKLKLNVKKLTLKKGKKSSLKLTITSTAKTAKDKKALKNAVKWSSSNKKVATVSKAGKVTAKKKGKATITAKLKGKKVSCKVTVK